MPSLTIRLGTKGDESSLSVEWFGTGYVTKRGSLDLKVREEGGVRLVDVFLNGVKVGELR